MRSRHSFRVCLITPGHLSTNPRLVKEADALASAGYDTRVIAADFSRWGREADLSFAARPWRVVRTLPFGPDAPRFSRAVQLARQRAAVLIAGVGSRWPPIVCAAWHPIAPDLIKATKRMPADLYIAHYPAALPAAAKAAGRHGGLYAFDAEDFHIGDLPDEPEHEPNRRLVRAIEARYLPGCAFITAASPGIADSYANAYHIARPTVVLNAFPASQAPSSPTPRGTAEPRPSVYWFSQTIGPDRGLECAVQAVGRSRLHPHLYLRGSPTSGFVDRLQTIAGAAGAADRLHILSPAAPSAMERLAASYDVGFVGETGWTANRRVALTNKLFTYLLAGLPVVMSDIPAHCAFAPEVGDAARLYTTDDADSLAAALESLLEDPELLEAARAAAFRLGQTRFNWDFEKPKLLEKVGAALAIGTNVPPRTADDLHDDAAYIKPAARSA
jgi:glycosyltransferase involved in cell wall biosynthesis